MKENNQLLGRRTILKAIGVTGVGLGGVGGFNGSVTAATESVSTPIEFWRQTYGGNERDVNRDMIQTNDGGYMLVGSTRSFIDGDGNTNAWIVKTDSTGSEQWHENYIWGTFNSVIQISDGGYILAGDSEASDDEFWLMRIDSSGVTEWSTYFGGDPAWAFSVVQTDNEKFAAAGGIDRQAGIAKVDSDGNKEWSRTYGGRAAQDMVYTHDDAFVFVGSVDSGSRQSKGRLTKISNSGNVVWSKLFGGDNRSGGFGSITRTSDNGFAIAGGIASTSGDSSRTWLVKTDPNGNKDWESTFDVSPLLLQSIIETRDNGYALTGLGYRLLKTDSSGNKQWITTFNRGRRAFSVVQTDEGDYALGGTTDAIEGKSLDFILTKAGFETEIEIDVKPCNDSNIINANKKGVIPVGIKQTDNFDPNDSESGVIIDSLRFGAPDVVKGGGGAEPAHNGHTEDVMPCEGDDREDLVVHFSAPDTGFNGEEKSSRLEGKTEDGISLVGTDSIKFVGRR